MRVCVFEKVSSRAPLTFHLHTDPFVRSPPTVKVSFDAKGTLRSEKVVRLENGFPSTKREDDEHGRREEEALQGLTDRMGITMKRKADTIGNKQKPNDPCQCGSGKKYKKCCFN